MPSFDITSKVDMHEITNAIDQANREIENRFDFKDSHATFELKKDEIILFAQNTFQLQQMIPILELKMTKRKLDIRSLKINKPEENLSQAKQTMTIKQGIDHDLGKKITKLIKDSKIKVQASMQGEQIRITGKKRDDLQEIIALLNQQNFELPLQFENFRD